MKKVYLACLCIAISGMASAKIWRVNNNTGVVADFTNVQAAHDAAAVHNGDTLHVEASANGYGSLYMSKRLVVMGAGYYLAETSPMIANPKTEANTNISSISNLYFNPGSKGSSVSGMYVGSYCVIQDSMVTVQRCYINSDLYFADSYTAYSGFADTIRQNIIAGGFRCGYQSTGKFQKVLAYNNLVFSGTGADFGSNINNIDGYFINNNFIYYYSAFGNTIGMTTANFVYQNNIFGQVNFGAYQSSNVYFNNICMGAGVPAGNSNVQNVDVPGTVFKDWTGNGAGLSSDGRYALKPGGTDPAIGAGTLNGGPVDCGAFGGPAPYILSGMPNAPSIYVLTVPTQINSGTASMNITLSSASH